MIAHCPACDARIAAAGSLSTVGYRWDAKQAGLSRWLCPDHYVALRAKRKGDSESVILTARLMKTRRTEPIPGEFPPGDPEL